MATVEIDDSASSLEQLHRLTPGYVRLRDSEKSPSGYRWIELLIEDNASGEFQATTAADVLAALETASRRFQAFRIVFGEEWLRRASAMRKST